VSLRVHSKKFKIYSKIFSPSCVGLIEEDSVRRIKKIVVGRVYLYAEALAKAETCPTTLSKKAVGDI